MRSASIFSAILSVCATAKGQSAAEANLSISARTGEVESDWAAVYYSTVTPVLVGNDGGAASGGFRTWNLEGETPLAETRHETPGRTKLAVTVYDVGGKDLITTIAQPDSYFRIYDASTVEQIGGALAQTLGDWSALCSWRSQSSGEQYLYLFGKRQAIQLLVREGDAYEIIEVQTFETPVEASSCSVSQSSSLIFFSGDDSRTVYTFDAAESVLTPMIDTLGEATDDVTGLTTYIGNNSDYLFVAQKDVIGIYSTSFELLGSLSVTGDQDIEVQGLSVYQAETETYPAGVLAYAIESESGAGFGVSSLASAFEQLKLDVNTAFDPRNGGNRTTSPICAECNLNGFCTAVSTGASIAACSCFAGFNGSSCKTFTCRNNCSGHGQCIGANQCSCEDGWGGLYCAFKVVTANAETDANGGDGDDPAIWISPVDKAQSRIVTTTKSAVGAGLGVFDLEGKLLQTIAAGEPNNVDVIYGFRAGNRTIDLVYAACRADNTLCLFEMTANGTLQAIAGGSQPTKDDYEVYGSCVYLSRKTGKQYLFVNAKSAEYLQYELTWSSGSLNTTLVRNFTGGSGGQVEGCVSDEANGWVIIGEEPSALWRYGAEPADDSEPVLIGKVGDGKMYADVEGVTLVEGPMADQGFILVSQQGVSAYNVYRRVAPHEYVATFTISENSAKGIDAVSNTDGITAVGTGLGDLYPNGLIVVHDDANQLAGGGTSDEASFKLVSLGEALGEELMQEVDVNWDPRSSAIRSKV